VAAVQPVPDDEIAAELASSWGPEGVPPARGAQDRVPIDERAPVLVRRQASGRLEPADLRRAVERVAPVSLARERALPLSPAFADLLPSGLVRGSTVVVAGAEAGLRGPNAGTGLRGPNAGAGAALGSTGSTALALALAAPASAAGSWVALVGLPALGLAAAAEAGVALERLVVVERPPPEHWATVVGALVGAFDVVMVGEPGLRGPNAEPGLRGPNAEPGLRGPNAEPGRVRPAEVRRLLARCRERGTVLVQLAGAAGGAPVTGRSGGGAPAWAADLRMSVATIGWDGLDEGHGLLRRRRVAVEVTGRRAAARVRRGELWLPDDEGRVRPVEPGEVEARDLAAARHQRIRRAARRPVPVPRGTGAAAAGAAPPAVAGAWSDAG
jgi:hypothetical protein